MAGHGVRLGGGGSLELVRTSPPEDPGRLRQTTAALRAAAGAGAVEVLSMTDDGEVVELVVAFAGRSPSAPVEARELARIGAAVAANLADLHLRGIAHGAVIADHVLVDAAGTVRLCGFGAAGSDVPATDVFAVGSMLTALLDERDRGGVAEAIRAAAARCQTEPSARPSMSAVAAALASAHGPRATIAPAPRPRRARPRWPIALAVIASLAVVFAIARPTASSPRPAIAATVTSSTSTTSTTVAGATRIWPTSAASTVVGDGARWSWGRASDVSLMGDWDCDGVDTPALVQPSGALWLIDTWPDDNDATARYVTTVDGVIDATVDHGPSCDAVLLTTADGRQVRPPLRAE